jgi:hypothetical protein
VRSYDAKRTTKLKHRYRELTSLVQRPGRRPVDPKDFGCLSEAHRYRMHGFDGRRVCDRNSTCRYWLCHVFFLLSPASSTLAVRAVGYELPGTPRFVCRATSTNRAELHWIDSQKVRVESSLLPKGRNRNPLWHKLRLALSEEQSHGAYTGHVARPTNTQRRSW